MNRKGQIEMEKNRIIELLIQKADTEFHGDVAVIAGWGSEESRKYYYIPRTERGYELGGSFLVKGSVVSFEPCTWEWLAQCRKGDRREVGMLLGGELLYAYSEKEASYFEQLRELSLRTEDKEKYLKAMMLRCKELYFTFYENEKDAAMLAVDLLERISYALLYANDSYLKGNYHTLAEEVASLERVPECYGEAVKQIAATADPQVLKRVCQKLIAQTNALLNEEGVQEPEKLSAKVVYDGMYEQAKELYQNIIDACFAGKADSALLYAKKLQQKLDQAAARSNQAPQLKNLLDLYYRKDLAAFAVSIYSHEASLIGFLLNQEIPFTQYANIERFEEEMLSR